MHSPPSPQIMRAEPLVDGRMSDSAINGRNCVGVRESGRMGGVSVREVCRYESSAGDSGVPVCWPVCRGAMALANWALLVVVVVKRFCFGRDKWEFR